jgi:hypothetical protein
MLPGLQRTGKIRGRLGMSMNLLKISSTFFLPLCGIEPEKWAGLTIEALVGLAHFLEQKVYSMTARPDPFSITKSL